MKNKMNFLKQKEAVLKQITVTSFALIIMIGLSGCGEVSDLEKQMKQVEKGEKTGMEVLMEQNKNVSKFKGIPSWAKKLGAVEPTGLTLNPDQSDSIAEDAKKHMNESFHAQYTGEPEVLMSEAKKLVKAVGGKISIEEKDFLLASGKLDGGAYSLSITVRTDIDEPFMSYMIGGRKSFE